MALIVLLPAPALANGQTTHVWITLQAIEHVTDPTVRDLVTRPELRDMLMNGGMFPDGGYAVDDGYGELAHWEPFQQAYADWIRAEFDPPYDQGPAAEHVAFLFGMGSHGMADEVFDSLFMERSRIEDPGWGIDGMAALDTASDVLMVHLAGVVQRASFWLPDAVIQAVFRDALGYDVSLDTLQTGHQRLFGALDTVEELSFLEERVETFSDAYPWTLEHLLDPGEPGSPLHEAIVVAAYWEDLWRRLNGEAPASPVLAFVPGDGSWAHPLDASLVQARLQVTFARGVDGSTLDALRVRPSGGDALPMDVARFYGDMNHAIVLKPQEDWAPDTLYELVVGDGLMDYDGAVFAPWTATFSTSAPPDPPPEDVCTDACCPCFEPGGAFAAVSPERSSALWAGLLAFGVVRRRP